MWVEVEVEEVREERCVPRLTDLPFLSGGCVHIRAPGCMYNCPGYPSSVLVFFCVCSPATALCFFGCVDLTLLSAVRSLNLGHASTLLSFRRSELDGSPRFRFFFRLALILICFLVWTFLDRGL